MGNILFLIGLSVASIVAYEYQVLHVGFELAGDGFHIGVDEGGATARSFPELVPNGTWAFEAESKQHAESCGDAFQTQTT